MANTISTDEIKKLNELALIHRLMDYGALPREGTIMCSNGHVALLRHMSGVVARHMLQTAGAKFALL